MTDEVVQIYYHKPDSVVKRPKKTLIAFKRVKSLQPEEKRKVSFCIPLVELRYFDVISEEMLLETGEYQILAGCSSEQLLLLEKINLQGAERRKRNGFLENKAENFDFAGNYVLHSGHLGYSAVCSRNATGILELSYEKMYLEKAANQIKLDFWQANEIGAFEACQDWITKWRRIGFTEIYIPLKNIPVQKEFALSIQWQGMGKLCFYQFS